MDLCGSCLSNYGKSPSSECKECSSDIKNVFLALISVVVLMGIAGFTIKGNLESPKNKFSKIQMLYRKQSKKPVHLRAQLPYGVCE